MEDPKEKSALTGTSENPTAEQAPMSTDGRPEVFPAVPPDAEKLAPIVDMVSGNSGDSLPTPDGGSLSANAEDSHTLRSESLLSENSGDSPTQAAPVPLPNGKGWQLQHGRLTLLVERPHFDRSAIRAALTVREGETQHYHNVVNLTSKTARKRTLQELSEKKLIVDEDALLALEAVCRTPTAPSISVCESPAFAETSPLRFTELADTFNKWLLLGDDDYLPIFLGAVLAHRLKSDPVWLLIVAPPGATKSELLRSLYGYPGIYPLSQLTSRTLASGFGNRTDASLLSRLNDDILVLKDFTTVLEIGHEDRQTILAQLREVYDGRIDSAWGTGQELHWEGRLGFIAGVTPVIDSHQSAMGLLGERFVLLRPQMADRQTLARWTLDGAGRESTMRRDLQQAMHRCLKSSGSHPPEVPGWVVGTLAAVGDLVTRARSPVVRDRNRQLDFAPEPEAPTRFPKVLRTLAQGIALAFDSAEVTAREVRLVIRVALDSLPPVRRAAIATLATNGPASVGELIETEAFRCSEASLRRALEDLELLGVVERVGGHSTELRWTLLGEWDAILRPYLPLRADAPRDPVLPLAAGESPASDEPEDDDTDFAAYEATRHLGDADDDVAA